MGGERDIKELAHAVVEIDWSEICRAGWQLYVCIYTHIYFIYLYNILYIKSKVCILYIKSKILYIFIYIKSKKNHGGRE